MSSKHKLTYGTVCQIL